MWFVFMYIIIRTVASKLPSYPSIAGAELAASDGDIRAARLHRERAAAEATGWDIQRRLQRLRRPLPQEEPRREGRSQDFDGTTCLNPFTGT